MHALMKFQIVSNLKDSISFLIFMSIFLAMPIVKLDILSTSIICLLFFIKNVHYIGFLIDNHYYRQLLASPIRSMELYKISFKNGLIMATLFFISTLLFGLWQSRKLNETLFNGALSPSVEAIVIAFSMACVLLVALGYIIHYSYADGLSNQYADEFLVLFAVLFLYGVPTIIFVFSLANDWLAFRLVIVLFCSLFIYYRMYRKTITKLPSFIIKLDIDYFKKQKNPM